MGSYAIFDSPIGTLLVATTTYGVCKFGLLHDEGRQLKALEDRFGEKFEEDAGLVRPFLRYVRWHLEGSKVVPGWSVDLRFVGNFARKTYEVLKRVGWGRVTTYKDLAEALGKPKATRAVGQAMAKNPLLLIIPCHRVVESDGKLGGFGGGMGLKERLLTAEGVYVVNGRVPLQRYRATL